MALPPTYSVGTVTVSAGESIVTGIDTMFVAAGLREGDIFERDGLSVTIASVDSNTQITLVKPWPGADGSGAYEVRYIADGGRVLPSVRQAILEFETIRPRVDALPPAFRTRVEAVAAEVPPAVDFIQVGGLIYQRDPSGAALETAGGVRWSPAGDVSAAHFGTSSDLSAAAENAEALTNAFAFAKEISVPGVSIPLADSTLLHTIRGQAGSVITRPPLNLEGTRSLFNLQDGSALRDLSIALQADTAVGALLLGRWTKNDLLFDRVDFDGGVITDADGVRNYHGSFLQNIGGTNLSGLRIRDSRIRYLSYVFLKANTTVSTEKHISVTGSEFDEMSTVALLFNSPAPGSLIEDVLIHGNRIGSNRNKGGFWHRGSFAGHVKGGRVVHNFFHGDGGEIWRMEEAAEGCLVQGNVGYLNGEHGFETVSNDATNSGTMHTPEKVIFSDNILIGKPGATGSAIHITVTTKGSGLRKSILHDNILAGEWEHGIRTAEEAATVPTHHNLIDGPGVGLRAAAPTLSITDTTLVDVSTPIEAGHGGLIGPLHIRAVDGVIPPAPAVMVSATSAEAAVGVTEWTWEAHRFTLEAGVQEFPLLPVGYFIDGKATISFTRNDLAHRMITGQLEWDGTTLSFSDYRQRGTGTVAFSGNGADAFGVSSGRLVVRLNNSGGSLSGVTLQVCLHGIHTWLPVVS